jgi:hypothetical protein
MVLKEDRRIESRNQKFGATQSAATAIGSNQKTERVS